MTELVLLVLLALLGGCKDKQAAPVVDITDADLANVTAAIPADLTGVMPGTLGADTATLGQTGLVIGSNCDGRCENKDGAAVSDKVNFAPLAAGKGKVLEDVKGKHTRTMVFEAEPTGSAFDTAITIVTAWWDPDGEQYFTCRAELGVPAKGLADAFEKVCSKVSGG